MQNNDEHRYDDLLDLPHHVSAVFPHMSMSDRAAQFAPFAALTGYHAAIDETGRYTESFVTPDELRQMQLNETLSLLLPVADTHPQVQITFFDPDDSKEGGVWQTVTETIEAIDAGKQTLFLADGTQIGFSQIREICTQFS